MTGSTLAAALKMRCDTSGADYAIFWVNLSGELVVSGSYETPVHAAAAEAAGQVGSFARATEFIKLSANGCTGPVSAVYNLGQPVFIADAGSCDPVVFKRTKLAAAYGVNSICFVPCEAGVLEFGTTGSWAEIPDYTYMPKQEIRKAFEYLGASYAMYWAREGDEFFVKADYVTETRLRSLRNRRSDDRTFCSASREFRLRADGEGPVAMTANLGTPLYVTVAEAATMQRRELAEEFGVKGLYLIPVEGGVLECGITEETRLSGNALGAAMKMRCDNSGAGYALYWAEEDGQFVVAGDYVSPERRKALKSRGLEGSFAEASKQVTLDAAGDGPVARTYRFKEPVFVQDAASCESLLRKDFAATYDVASVCFVPVEGGVLEFGTSRGPETATWAGMPEVPDMPKAEMKTAFDEFEADYAIFWRLQGGQYVVGADYVTPEHTRSLRNKRGDDISYTAWSRMFTNPAYGGNYVSKASLSGKVVVVQDPHLDANLQRRAFAEEFRISEIRFVPCKEGVLEYGKSAL